MEWKLPNRTSLTPNPKVLLKIVPKRKQKFVLTFFAFLPEVSQVIKILSLKLTLSDFAGIKKFCKEMWVCHEKRLLSH